MLHAMPARKNTRTSSSGSNAHTTRSGKRTSRKPRAKHSPAAKRSGTHAKRTRRRASRASRPAATRRRSFLAFAGVLAFVLVFCLALACTGTYTTTLARYDSVEQWRALTQRACEDCELGEEWADVILALMYIESGGDEDVESVTGVQHDIMQAAESAYGSIVTDGSDEYGVQAETCAASIYAGVLEFKASLQLWEAYLGSIEPTDTGAVQLVVQGYNFGASGWQAWCEENGVTAYSVSVAQEYSEEQMPEGAKGTPTHAKKWLAAYETIAASSE